MEKGAMTPCKDPKEAEILVLDGPVMAVKVEPQPGQLIARLPGSMTLCSKCQLAQLAEGLSGARSWQVPETLVMPEDPSLQPAAVEALARRLAENDGSRWLMKPVPGSFTVGIVGPTTDPALLLRSASLVAPCVVQRVVEDVALIEGHKFDFRLLVLGAWGRWWLHDEWLVRVAAAAHGTDGGFFTVSAAARGELMGAKVVPERVRPGNLSSGPAKIATVVGAALTEGDAGLQCVRDGEIEIPGGSATVSSVTEAVACLFEDGFPDGPEEGAFGFYGVDVMLTAGYDPVILEVNMGPDTRTFRSPALTDVFRMAARGTQGPWKPLCCSEEQ